jgi:hypothetical protein
MSDKDEQRPLAQHCGAAQNESVITVLLKKISPRIHVKYECNLVHLDDCIRCADEMFRMENREIQVQDRPNINLHKLSIPFHNLTNNNVVQYIVV